MSGTVTGSGSLNLDKATATALGGIKVSTGLTINASTGALSVSVPTANDFTTACCNKLAGITAGATANTGTVTSVSGGTGLSGTVTGSGSLNLDIATNGALGGVKFGCGCNQGTAANTFTETANRTYSVTPNSTNQMLVNVPWDNTEYSKTVMRDCVDEYFVSSVTAASPLTATTGVTPQISLPTSAVVTVKKLCTTGTDDCVKTTCLKGSFSAGSLTGSVGPSLLPVASSSCFGGVKFGCSTTQTVSAGSVYTCSSRTYSVQPNSSNQMVVNVPWTDTNTGATSVGTKASDVLDISSCEICAVDAGANKLVMWDNTSNKLKYTLISDFPDLP